MPHGPLRTAAHQSRAPGNSLINLMRKTVPTAIRMLMTAIAIMGLSAACAARPRTAAQARPNDTEAEAGLETYQRISAVLDKGGATIDYDALMQIDRLMFRTAQPIAHTDRLIDQLIRKRNDNPRIDQMILIFAARIIGGSRYVIPGAQDLLAAILRQQGRINEWVVMFVADAIENYGYDLPQGGELVDLMEAELARIRSVDRSQDEYFGFHFLPPPKSDFIRSYINGIEDRRSRQRERAIYYTLIKNNLTEDQIETALRYLQANGSPGGAESCPLLLQCLMRHFKQLPFR